MNKIKIEVTDVNNKLQNYLIRNHIKYSSLNKNKNKVTFICEYNSYVKINKRFKTRILKYYGRKNLHYKIKKHKYALIAALISIYILLLLTNTIFNVKVNTKDKKLEKELITLLERYNIKKYKKKKTFKEITQIKQLILEEYKNKLEWIEIENYGTKYIINITKKITKNNDNNFYPTNIVATKDGIIKHINSISGTKVKNVGDYVKKGEVIISGIITKNDEIKDLITSKGEVYAETWYKVDITVPYNYIEYVKTNKIIKRYYLEMFGYEFTLTGKYDKANIISEKKLLLDKPYLFFKLYKETKYLYEYKNYSLTKEESYKEALKRADLKIKNILDNKEYIISKKVLKKSPFRSKMYVEVFYKVYENIANTERIKDLGENYGINN